MLNRLNTSENLKDVIRIKDSEKETAIINLIAAAMKLSTEIAKYPNSIMNLLSSYSWLVKWVFRIVIFFLLMQQGIILDYSFLLSF